MNKISKNKVAVLGRGKSLKKFSKFSHLFDTLYIVGTFHKEINKIGYAHFKGKKIIHLVGRSDWGWRGNADKGLNIDRVQTMYYKHQLKRKKGKKGILEKFKNFKIGFLPDNMKNRGLPMVSREVIEKYSREYENREELCVFLENKYKKEIKKSISDANRNRYWPTTGAFAIDTCLMENIPEEIYIFGIDACYELSFAKYKWEDSKYDFKNQKEGRPFTVKEKLIIYYIKELVKEFSKTEFYSASKVIKMKHSNWNII
jgi:hypothetical protein